MAGLSASRLRVTVLGSLGCDAVSIFICFFFFFFFFFPFFCLLSHRRPADRQKSKQLVSQHRLLVCAATSLACRRDGVAGNGPRRGLTELRGVRWTPQKAATAGGQPAPLQRSRAVLGVQLALSPPTPRSPPARLSRNKAKHRQLEGAPAPDVALALSGQAHAVDEWHGTTRKARCDHRSQSRVESLDRFLFPPLSHMAPSCLLH